MQLAEPAGLVHRWHQASTGIDLHVVERPGSGVPVVLLHGIWGSWRAWLPLLALDPDPFDGRPLHMVDLRGHGKSGHPARGYGLGDYAVDVIDLIGSFDRPVILVGHSLGALAALAALSAVADRLDAVILEEPPLPLPAGPENLDATWSAFAEAVVSLSMLKHEPVAAIAEHLTTEYPDLSWIDAEEAAVSISQTADGVFSAIMMGDFGGTDAALPADAIDVPALVFQADLADDQMLKDVGVTTLRGVLPRLELVRLPGSGHAIHYASPVEFGAAVAKFLDAAL